MSHTEAISILLKVKKKADPLTKAIQEGIKAADRGDFASETELERVFNKYRVSEDFMEERDQGEYEKREKF